MNITKEYQYVYLTTHIISEQTYKRILITKLILEERRKAQLGKEMCPMRNELPIKL